MIKSFLHRGLAELFQSGKSAAVPANLQNRCRLRLDVLHAATDLQQLSASPGLGYHPLKGPRRGRHAIAVNGPWRITFEWTKPHAYRVDLEQYH